MFNKRLYIVLPAAEKSTETDIPLLSDSTPLRTKARTGLPDWAHWLFHGLSLISILGLAIGIQSATYMSRSKCWDMFNYYSPVNEAVAPHPYVHQVFNGSLWNKNPFKGPPNEVTEKAWYDIMKYGMISVTKDDLAKVHHPSWSAQFPPSVGGGYIAATIGAHQIHCLHYIWQDHYTSYFPKVQDKKHRVPELYELHYEHCVDYIRQSLMCQFDTGIIPYNWVLDHQNPTPNGNTHHKCTDWGKLQEWLGSRKVDMPEGFVWEQPEGAVTLDYNP